MRRGPEKRFWTWLDGATTGLWDVQRHEDKYSVGIPDLSYGANGVNGWIELKAYDEWPTGTISHYTPKQAAWLTNRGMMGGHCYILVRIGSTILLYDWKVAYRLLHAKGEYELCRCADKMWESAFDRKEFIRLITWELR